MIGYRRSWLIEAMDTVIKNILRESKFYIRNRITEDGPVPARSQEWKGAK